MTAPPFALNRRWAAAFAPLLLLAGCGGETPAARNDTAKKPVAVKTVPVVEEELQRTTTQPATVHPYYRAEIRAKVSGYVKAVKADIGDHVEAGAPLAEIDVPEMHKQKEILQARIKRYEAEEKRATANVELAKANVLSAQAKLAQARSELKRTDAMVAAAEAEFLRTEDLVQRRSLESRVLDEVRKKRDAELANQEAVSSAIQSADAEVAVAKARQSSIEADFAIAQAETEIANRQLEELDVLIAYATIKAPFSGIVTNRAVDPGDLVREGSEVGAGEPLFVVSQIETVRVHISVPEADAALVNRGDAVKLTLPSFPDEKPIEAGVTRRAEYLDRSTRTMLVEAEVKNPDRKLLPGMFGQATISLSNKVAARMLPARAIRFEDSGRAYVYVVDDEETISVVDVTTGHDDGHSIEILSGVEAGQDVVDAHLQRFTAGQKVTVLKN